MYFNGNMQTKIGAVDIINEVIDVDDDDDNLAGERWSPGEI